MHAPMNSRNTPSKPSLKERYVAMTRGLAWNTTYQPMEKVFPFDRYEGIRIHDWNLWEDPFRLTMDAYWKYQGEKDKKLYAVIDAFAQNNGHMGISNTRYVNAIKLFIQESRRSSTARTAVLRMSGGSSSVPVLALHVNCKRSTSCGISRPKPTQCRTTINTTMG